MDPHRQAPLNHDGDHTDQLYNGYTIPNSAAEGFELQLPTDSPSPEYPPHYHADVLLAATTHQHVNHGLGYHGQFDTPNEPFAYQHREDPFTAQPNPNDDLFGYPLPSQHDANRLQGHHDGEIHGHAQGEAGMGPSQIWTTTMEERVRGTAWAEPPEPDELYDHINAHRARYYGPTTESTWYPDIALSQLLPQGEPALEQGLALQETLLPGVIGDLAAAAATPSESSNVQQKKKKNRKRAGSPTVEQNGTSGELVGISQDTSNKTASRKRAKKTTSTAPGPASTVDASYLSYIDPAILNLPRAPVQAAAVSNTGQPSGHATATSAEQVTGAASLMGAPADVPAPPCSTAPVNSTAAENLTTVPTSINPQHETSMTDVPDPNPLTDGTSPLVGFPAAPNLIVGALVDPWDATHYTNRHWLNRPKPRTAGVTNEKSSKKATGGSTAKKVPRQSKQWYERSFSLALSKSRISRSDLRLLCHDWEPNDKEGRRRGAAPRAGPSGPTRPPGPSGPPPPPPPPPAAPPAAGSSSATSTTKRTSSSAKGSSGAGPQTKPAPRSRPAPKTKPVVQVSAARPSLGLFQSSLRPAPSMPRPAPAVVERPPLPTQRPVDPVGALRYDTIKTLWRPKTANVSPAESHEAFLDFSPLANKLREDWARVVGEGKSGASSAAVVPALFAQQRQLLAVSVAAALEHGHPAVIKRLGAHETFVLHLCTVLRDRVAADDYSEASILGLLELLARMLPTQQLLEKLKFFKLASRIAKNGGDRVRELADRIVREAAAAAEAAKSAPTTTGGASEKPTPTTTKRSLDPTTSSSVPAVKKQASSGPTGAAPSSMVSKPAARSGLPTDSRLQTKTRPAPKKMGAVRYVDPSIHRAYPGYGGDDVHVLADRRRSSSTVRPFGTAQEPKSPWLAAPPAPPAPAPKQHSIMALMDTYKKQKQEEAEEAARKAAERNKPEPTLQPGPAETADQKRIRLRKQSRRHLRIRWKPDEELVQVRVFRHDDDEDEGRSEPLLLDAHDAGQEGATFRRHRQMEMVQRKTVDLDPTRPFQDPPRLNFDHISPAVQAENMIKRGGTSQPRSEDKRVQEERESNILSVIYGPGEIPPTPNEPITPQAPMNTDAVEPLGRPAESTLIKDPLEMARRKQIELVLRNGPLPATNQPVTSTSSAPASAAAAAAASTSQDYSSLESVFAMVGQGTPTKVLQAKTSAKEKTLDEAVRILREQPLELLDGRAARST
ncbi:MAG: hypothetical protein M1823_000993 [Watsoniomyces obsoletus]|nr:MAG: hypothetical protein M1823_000993 [Watsoniomyces obsoletus]